MLWLTHVITLDPLARPASHQGGPLCGADKLLMNSDLGRALGPQAILAPLTWAAAVANPPGIPKKPPATATASCKETETSDTSPESQGLA